MIQGQQIQGTGDAHVATVVPCVLCASLTITINIKNPFGTSEGLNKMMKNNQNKK